MRAMDFELALSSVHRELNIPYQFKDKQIECMEAICNQHDVFCLLPTGYGKADIFSLPPLILDKVKIALL